MEMDNGRAVWITVLGVCQLPTISDTQGLDGGVR